MRHRQSRTGQIAAVLVAAYLVAAVVAFGRAWNTQPPTRYAWVIGKHLPTEDVDRMFAGFFAGLFWPAYVSVVLWAPNDRDVMPACQEPRTPSI